jgi:DNA invertase Pin-like site-specific DNA recombinase
MFNTATVKRFLGYRRVSTGEQSTAGTSLDGQKDELVALAARTGAAVVLDFVEVESGCAEREERRIEVAKLLDAVRPGDVVAVTKVDRFTRDLEFAIRKVREILRKGARFISIAEGEFDPTPEGELKLAMWASIAQMERARIRDRCQGQKTRLRAGGAFVEGRTPFGYVRATGRDSHDKPRRLVVVPEKAAIVVEAFDLCIRGFSLSEIARELRRTHAGYRLAEDRINQMIKNRTYAGQLATTPFRPRDRKLWGRATTQWVDTHETIVPMDVWQRAQAALASRRLGGDRPHAGSGTEVFVLRSLAVCGICGAVARCSIVKRKKTHGYYVCRHRNHPPEGRPRCLTAPHVRQDVADAYVEKAALARLVELRDLLAAPPPPRAAAPDFASMRATVAAKRARLVRAVAAGKLSLDDIDAPLRELDDELADIEATAAGHAARGQADTVESRRAALAYVEGISDAWAGLTIPERRSVIAILAERVIVTAKGTIDVTWRDASGMTTSIASTSRERRSKLAAAAE